MSLIESLRSAPPRRQMWLIGAAGVVLALCLVAAYLLFLRTPYGVLFNNLRPLDAATIVSELDKRKTPYRLEAGGSTILVPQRLVASTRLAVMTEDLPLKGTVGFELFNKSDMGLTEFAQRINYQRALQGELARTIMSIDSVDQARVHLAMADETVFRDDRRPAKASVTLLPKPGRSLSGPTVRGIQKLVASAVPDLAAEDVVVLDEHGAPLSADPAPAPSSAVATQQQAVELFYAARVRQALAPLYPAGVSVSVSAKLEPGPTAIDGQGAALMAWTPANRTFPIVTTVVTPAPVSPVLEQQLRVAASQAVGADASRGDVVIISLGQGAPSASPYGPPAAAPAPPASPTPLRPAAVPPFPTMMAVLALVVLAAVGAALAYALRPAARQGRLTQTQREDLARRLRLALEREDAHAAS